MHSIRAQSTTLVNSLRRLVTGFSPQRRKFNNKVVHMAFVVGKVAMGQVFLWIFWFSRPTIIPPVLHTHLLSGIVQYSYTRSPYTYNHKKLQLSIIDIFLLFFRHLDLNRLCTITYYATGINCYIPVGHHVGRRPNLWPLPKFLQDTIQSIVNINISLRGNFMIIRPNTNIII